MPTTEEAFTMQGNTLVGYNSDIGGVDVVIPSTINGEEVHYIEGAFKGKDPRDNPDNPDNPSDNEGKGLTGEPPTSIVFPSTLKKIRSNEFERAKELLSVDIPSAPEGIESGAFSNCRNLETVKLGAGVKTVESYAFAYGSIETLELAEGLEEIRDHAFQKNKIQNLVIPTSVKKLGHSSFNVNQLPDSQAFLYARTSEGIDNTKLISYGGANRSAVILPTTVIDLQMYCFYLTNIRKITLHDGVKIIAHNAFGVCDFSEISLPENLESIGGRAFAQTKLQHIDIPKKIKIISSQTFADCNQLSSITLPEGLTNIGSYAFSSCKFTTINLPKSLKRISDNAFRNNPGKPVIGYRIGGAKGVENNNTEDIRIEAAYTDESAFIFNPATNTITGYKPEIGGLDIAIPPKIGGVNVKKISRTVFLKKGLTSVSFPDTPLFIGEGAFSGNELTEVILPDTVTLEELVFQRNKITHIEIPSNMKIIPYGTFTKNALKLINIPEGVEEIAEFAFSENQIVSLVIPNTVTLIDGNAFEKNKIEDIFISPSVKKIAIEAFLDNSIGTLDIPDSVEYIGKKAFMGNKITKLKLSKNLTHIGSNAFAENKINTHITLPDSLTTMDQTVFLKNEIPSVTIGSGLKVLNKGVFMENKLKSVFVPANIKKLEPIAFEQNELSDVTLSEGLESIGNLAFARNKIDTLNIPNSVTTIGKKSFMSNLDKKVIGYRRDGTEGITVADDANIEIRFPPVNYIQLGGGTPEKAFLGTEKVDAMYFSGFKVFPTINIPEPEPEPIGQQPRPGGVYGMHPKLLEQPFNASIELTGNTPHAGYEFFDKGLRIKHSSYNDRGLAFYIPVVGDFRIGFTVKYVSTDRGGAPGLFFCKGPSKEERFGGAIFNLVDANGYQGTSDFLYQDTTGAWINRDPFYPKGTFIDGEYTVILSRISGVHKIQLHKDVNVNNARTLTPFAEHNFNQLYNITHISAELRHGYYYTYDKTYIKAITVYPTT